LQESPERFDFDNGAFILKPQENNTMMWAALAIDLFAEVLVIRDQYPMLSIGFDGDVIVCDATRLVIHGEDFV
jgi:hypothetical protein